MIDNYIYRQTKTTSTAQIILIVVSGIINRFCHETENFIVSRVLHDFEANVLQCVNPFANNLSKWSRIPFHSPTKTPPPPPQKLTNLLQLIGIERNAEHRLSEIGACN